MKFPYDDDTVYLAHCYPYTYTDLHQYLSKVCINESRDRIRKTVLCKSLAGNDVDVLIITNFNSEPIELSLRKSVILTSRVHPGESNSSWIMQGAIDYLVSDEETAKFLRNTFVFKIIPM